MWATPSPLTAAEAVTSRARPLPRTCRRARRSSRPIVAATTRLLRSSAPPVRTSSIRPIWAGLSAILAAASRLIWRVARSSRAARSRTISRQSARFKLPIAGLATPLSRASIPPGRRWSIPAFSVALEPTKVRASPLILRAALTSSATRLRAISTRRIRCRPTIAASRMSS
ncbi:MAG: hypothetical protein JMDDDDMK_01164 [Acidobacteria bacterium]|nr:hypothetical protein [Acidobacteriota bacterium]